MVVQGTSTIGESSTCTRDRYNAGLGNLRIYIEASLEDSGARMGMGSVFHPAWPTNGPPPDKLKIFIVPYNASGMESVFSRDEICECHKGVVLTDVRGKVRAVVDRFINYRANATFAIIGTRGNARR